MSHSVLVVAINILRELLHERTSLQAEDVDSLCDELSRITEDRNVIAQNPVASDDMQGANSRILVVRHGFDPSNGRAFTETDLEALLKRTRATLKKFQHLAIETSKS